MPPAGGWDDTVKPVGTRVRLTTGRYAGRVGTVERLQRVTRPAWDELHHWVRLDDGPMRLYAARFLSVVPSESSVPPVESTGGAPSD